MTDLKYQMERCSRKIKTSMLEKLDPDLQNWWNKTFKMLEDDYVLPPEYRKEIIEDIFPSKVSQKIFKILTMTTDTCESCKEHETSSFYGFDSKVENKEIEREPSPVTLVGRKLIPGLMAMNVAKKPSLSRYKQATISVLSGRYQKRKPTIVSDMVNSTVGVTSQCTDVNSFSNRGKTAKNQRSVSENTGADVSSCFRSRVTSRVKSGSDFQLNPKPGACKMTTKTYNPYMKFFKANEERVAIWRVLPPLTMEEMNLTQKAEAIATSIAEDFISWMTNMGGAEKATMDVEGVIKMFEIGFNTHAATSLCVRVREMPCVPPAVAIANNLPQFGKRETLRRHVMRDIAASKLPHRTRGFNTMLPEDLIYLPPSAAQAERWMKCNVVPQELATMKKVWEGRTQLRSVRAFCQYLLKHPKVKRPKYLLDEGMFDENFLKQSRYSIESFSPEGEVELVPIKTNINM